MDDQVTKEDDYQTKNIVGALVSGKSVILSGPGGTGKCLHKNTKVLLYNGGIKKAKHIVPNDVLIGDDSGPRIVESVCSGFGNLYRIKTGHSESYVVNESHILTLKQVIPYFKENTSEGLVIHYTDGESAIVSRLFPHSAHAAKSARFFCKFVLQRDPEIVFDIRLKDYLSKPLIWRKFFQTYKVAVDYPVHDLEYRGLDPYFFGSWMKACQENYRGVKNMTTAYTRNCYGNEDVNVLLELFDMTGGDLCRRIFATRLSFRRNVVAGLIDESAMVTTDSKNRNLLYIQSKDYKFLKDIERLLRSVGLAAYTKPAFMESHQVIIYGDLSKIPTLLYSNMSIKKHRVHTSVLYEGWGEYYGFVIGGNRRFVLGNFFVTHNTHTLRKIATHLVLSKKNVHCTATTGVAALGLAIPEINLISRTFHSWAGIGLGDKDVVKLVKSIRMQPSALDRWKECEYLIIDEISMMGAELIGKINSVAKIVRKNSKPFGGIKLILSGDFLQLPPVKDKWAFQAECWSKLELVPFIFKEPKRYDDVLYFQMLLRIREGLHTQDDLKKLYARTVAYKNLIERLKGNITAIKPTIMYSTRADVDSFNSKELELLQTDARVYTAVDVFEKIPVASLKADSYRALLDNAISREITLKVGAQVMLKVNLDVPAGLVNGSRGVVLETGINGVLVRFINGLKVIITPADWKIEDNEGVAIRKQIPLILAWALTVHKSQGVTLDYAICDIGATVFSPGQAYVALSRVRNLKGLFISNFDYSCIRADKDALAYSKYLEKEELEGERKFVAVNDLKDEISTTFWKWITKEMWEEWLKLNLHEKEEIWMRAYKEGCDKGYGNAMVKPLVDSKKTLYAISVSNKEEWKNWLLHNHVDKGGDLEMCKHIISAGKELGW